MTCMDLGLSIALAAVLINVALSIFILSQDIKSRIGWVFAVTTLVGCLWMVSASISESPQFTFNTNNVANSIAFASGYLVIVCAMVFTYVFPVNKLPRRSTIILLLTTTITSVFLSFTPLVSGEAIRASEGVIEFSIGRLIWVYAILFMVPLIILARNLIARMRRGLLSRQRQQSKLVLIAFVVTALIGFSLNLAIPTFTGAWQSSQFGPLAIIFMTIILVYAIVRHGLFDIKRAAVRTFNYILTLLTLGFIYYVIAYFISNIILHNSEANVAASVSPLNVTLALLLAFIFQPIKRLFDRLTNRIFYRDNYSVDDFFANFNRKLISTTDLRKLLQVLAVEIGQTVKADQAFFMIYADEYRYITAGTPKHNKISKADTFELDALAKASGGDIILAGISAVDRSIERMMTSYRVGVILPLMQGGNVIGYLCLGEHKTSRYNERDIKVLETIADALVIAIQNALSIQEVRELNDTLQQRIDSATKELRASNRQLQRLDEAKDEFISMASHQLRTPLTSIKGYLSMLIEGDVGEVTKEQKHLLSEAFVSSERMVRLIGDFLNVSRLQTGKFVIDKRPVDLAALVERELESLESNASARGMKFVYKKPSNIPIIELDENKIEQVIMNFADNAIYYSKDNGKIIVNLEKKPDAVEFTVQDFGIGVPKAEQANLFNKFVRAANARKARPDGTGVGLFLARRVITEHGGSIIFKSVENEGSIFGFSLPLPKEKRG